jgi:hypothetical protein
MASVAMVVAGGAGLFSTQRPVIIKEFDRIVAPAAGQTAVRRATAGELGRSLRVVAGAVKCTTASEEVLKRVINEQEDTLWTFTRDEQLVGCFAMLMLNKAGQEALLRDAIDVLDPPSNFLVPTGAEPAAIYVWAVVGRSLAADGIAKVIVRLQSGPYKFADVYACPATRDGLRFMRKLGFEPVPGHPRNLFQYVRLANRLH